MTTLSIQDHHFKGYHSFIGGPDSALFEVFYVRVKDYTEGTWDADGWYWWSCVPGCLPDGDAVGPFPTAEGAYLDAQGD